MDRASVQEQVDRILHSTTFAGKSQLAKLLVVLFDRLDSQSTLKPDCIIRELWPDETKTKRSADVATEINRLRRALETYYDAEGATDPIIISLPNRSTTAAGSVKEKRWIVAEPRNAGQKPSTLPVPQATSRTRLKIIAAIAALVVTGVGAYLLYRMFTVVDQPRSARLDGSTLIVTNAKGQDLWRKAFTDGFSTEYYNQGLAQRIWFGDLNGNGGTDVLFLYQPSGSLLSHSTVLICYSTRGKEKWRWSPGRALPDLEGIPAIFETVAFGVLKAAPGTPARIVVSSHHTPWYPNQIAIVSADGKTVSEYWHSGQFYFMTLADLDGDGRQEIVASGVNNGYHQATLVVLDPDRVFGASTETVRPEIQIHGMVAAQERIRLLFPRSDLNKAVAKYNWGQEPTAQHGMISYPVAECESHPACFIWYEFDSNFHLLWARAGDAFLYAHTEFYRNDKANHPFTKQEESEFQKVRCLVGCKTEFVPVEIH
ncbi:MAG: hypothetical protein WAN69_11210 [Candidatus Korobacteraceae bacterium]